MRVDPIERLLASWAAERECYARSNSADLVALSETHEAELLRAIEEIANAPVPYDEAEQLTGWSLGSLKNGLANAGTRSNPAFRLGDLPFKPGRASSAKLLAAYVYLCKIGGRTI